MNKTTKNNAVECLWSHMVGGTSIDLNSNAVTLFNIVEEITGNIEQNKDKNKQENTLLPLSYEIISLWQRQGDLDGSVIEKDVIITLLSPENKEIQSIEYKLVIPQDKERMRFRVKVFGISFTTNGKYQFIVKTKEKDGPMTVGKILFDIKLSNK